ncbi:VPLPA-CTERM sorting domain-containing protein [Actibacterium sp. 188UL27-1]|uniref:VPLPA-CTERM sorting domain-containing protein n=1 Tax=Actibacterium sp. 188UL27-1 TaxID=2786961 RepID=UPI00195A9EB4|nr:VPLPA-CTERM sorting domain-containing protein [Actibacterium sp. 188UL27-1]MBM7067688.1 VPLPA-CTERM sorting domain-containing protein [Actibacterium sp. 188UL27-1]
MGGLTKLATLTVALVAVASTASAVTVRNGSFEEGFDRFSTFGAASIETSSYGAAPTDGTNQALLRSSNGVTDTAIETALGAAAGSLDAFSALSAGGGNATNGSVLTRTWKARVGDTLTFDFNFLTSESTPTSFNDGAFFFADGQYFSLGDTTSAGFTTSSTPFNEELGYASFSYTFTTYGTQTFGFGVFNEGDTSVSSGLLVDNVSVSPVPVPAALPLLLTAFGGLMVMGRRRRAA